MKSLRLLLTLVGVLLCWPLFANAINTLPEFFETGNIEPQLTAVLAGVAIYYVVKWLCKVVGRKAVPAEITPTLEPAVPVEPVASTPQQENAELGERTSDHGPSGY